MISTPASLRSDYWMPSSGIGGGIQLESMVGFPGIRNHRLSHRVRSVCPTNAERWWKYRQRALRPQKTSAHGQTRRVGVGQSPARYFGLTVHERVHSSTPGTPITPSLGRIYRQYVQ